MPSQQVDDTDSFACEHFYCLPALCRRLPRKMELTPDEVTERYWKQRAKSIQLRSLSRWNEFDLDSNIVRALASGNCEYCDGRASQIDRKDNDRGYVLWNVVGACKRCNMVKGAYLTYDEMMKVARVLGWRSDGA